jgi:hypothetical protein
MPKLLYSGNALALPDLPHPHLDKMPLHLFMSSPGPQE